MLPGEMMQADAHDMGRVFGIDFALRLSTGPLERPLSFDLRPASFPCERSHLCCVRWASQRRRTKF
ncbi:MAG: hypothetical protein KIS75_09585, partial [Chromatiales bacterium]|nr:hypothetical protein [Chromatiales bacterium]